MSEREMTMAEELYNGLNELPYADQRYIQGLVHGKLEEKRRNAAQTEEQKSPGEHC